MNLRSGFVVRTHSDLPLRDHVFSIKRAFFAYPNMVFLIDERA